MVSNNILVIGAGIVGLQVSIDLANMGFEVHLVESQPSVGGRMAQLDKTFPTNDCSICILAPKMIECVQHPNIETLTYSEVQGISGTVGDFDVRVQRKPRYVDIDKCTGCGECVEKCPTKAPNEFDMGMSERKAIYLPFPQAVPRKVTIDPTSCRMLTEGKCGICEKVCTAKAIDYQQKEETVQLNVGAVVICTGFDMFDMTNVPEYGYGRMANVLTAMEFERMLSASGPTLGHIQRPSDGREPKTIAFIQCVGSRDVNCKPYCTSVCCMHSVKEAVIANEHDPGLKSYIFNIDLRLGGKGFQEYVNRAIKEYDVTFVRSRPGSITGNGDGDLVLWYEDTHEGTQETLRVELVVLAQALVASNGTKRVADVLKVDMDQFGFLDIPDPLARPVDTRVPGIFACGFCQSPRDIPQGIVQASCAAARVAEELGGTVL